MTAIPVPFEVAVVRHMEPQPVSTRSPSAVPSTGRIGGRTLVHSRQLAWLGPSLKTQAAATRCSQWRVAPAVAGRPGGHMFTSFARRTPSVLRARFAAVSALRDDAGMATAEYAVATVAACGFGGVLYKLLSSDTVLQLLVDVIKKAFGFIL